MGDTILLKELPCEDMNLLAYCAENYFFKVKSFNL